MHKLQRRRRCAWPGCTEKPVEVGTGGMCSAHAILRLEDELEAAYRDFAEELEERRLAAKAEGQGETVPPHPPGPKELRRLRKGCLSLAKTRGRYLPERIRREVPVDPEKLGVVAARREDSLSFVDRGLTGVWSGRPSRRLTRQEWVELMAVLGLLSPREHEVFILVKGHRLTHRQAAVEMGVNAGTVYNLLARAEDKLEAWRNGSPAQAVLEI